MPSTKWIGDSPSSGGCILRRNIPTTPKTFTVETLTIKYTLCPEGPKPAEPLPSCVLEIDLGSSAWTSGGDGGASASTTLPIRIQSLPVSVSMISTSIESVLDNAASCTTRDFASAPVTVTYSGTPSGSRLGCEPSSVSAVSVDSAYVKGKIALCPSTDLTDAIANAIKGSIASTVIDLMTSALTDAASTAACRP